MERREPLSLDERRNLLRWGYHHVLDLFRFHITLTGPLPHEGAEQVEAALNQYLEPVIDKPLAMDSVCLFCRRTGIALPPDDPFRFGADRECLT